MTQGASRSARRAKIDGLTSAARGLAPFSSASSERSAQRTSLKRMRAQHSSLFSYGMSLTACALGLTGRYGSMTGVLDADLFQTQAEMLRLPTDCDAG